MIGFEITEPRSVDEALAMLEGDDPAVRPIAGGTALMLMMKAHLFKPQRLVSLRYLERFSQLHVSEDETSFHIGAMTTFAQLEHSALVRRHLPVVAQTMRGLANVRVRNVATVGGNIAHADPHLDLPPVWIALGAEAIIVGPGGERRVPLEDVFTGYYETSLGHADLIAALVVPVRPERRALYSKVTTRSAHDWPALGLAVSLERRDDRIVDPRVVLSAALDKPTRLSQTEEVLRSAPLGPALFARVCDAADAEVDITSDSRGSAPYKRQLLRVHLDRALQSLCQG